MIPLIGAGLGLGTSIFQAINGAGRAKRAQSAINNFERQELNNAYEDIAIPTTGTEIMREDTARNMAYGTDILRGAGARGILGGLTPLVGQGNEANRKNQAYIDDLIQRRDYAKAQDKARIRGIQENRDMNELAGLGQELQSGRQDMWSGITSGVNSLMYGMNNFGGFTPQVDSVNSGIQSQGMAPMPSTPLPTSNLPAKLDLGGF